MKWIRSNICRAVTFLLCCSVLTPAQSPQKPTARSEKEKLSAETKDTLLDRVLNYPFEDEKDMMAINAFCSLMLLEATRRKFLSKADESDGFQLWESFLREVAAFSTTEKVEGESVAVVSFAKSDDKAIRRLREEIGVPPPAGGAIVRIYRVKSKMPEPIQSLFRWQVEGITRWCRFIAVNAENKSNEELADTISHELAHSYISSSTGIKSDKLPRWFHEGVALYLSDAKDHYISQVEFGVRRVAWSPTDYDEYRLVFQYLEARVGRRALATFIRQSVQEHSPDQALRGVVGSASYSDLLERARQWRDGNRTRSGYRFWIGVAVFALLLGLWIFRRWHKRQTRIEQELHESEENRQLALRKFASDIEETGGIITLREYEDYKKYVRALIEQGRALAEAGQRKQAEELFQEAGRMAPSAELKYEAQKAWNEMNGIF